MSGGTVGDVILLESGWAFDRWIIARVVKVGKSMWALEPYRGIRWAVDGDVWEKPTKRKVGRHIVLPPQADLEVVREQLRAIEANLSEQIKVARAGFIAAIEELAA